MSGGSFAYSYQKTEEFAESLENKIERNIRDGYGFSAEVIAELLDIGRIAKETAKLQKATEWLYSCDIDEASFLEKVAEIKSYKITPEQMAEIESQLEFASYLLNSEERPNWENLNIACRQIADVREDLKIIRKRSNERFQSSD